MAETPWKQNWHIIVVTLLLGGMGGGFTVDKLLSGSTSGVSSELLDAKLKPLTDAILELKTTIRTDFAEERTSRERLFVDLSSRVESADTRLRSIELELAERRGRGQ